MRVDMVRRQAANGNAWLFRAWGVSKANDWLLVVMFFTVLQRYGSVKTTIERYKKACAASSNSGSTSEADAQFYQQEASKLRQQIGYLQNNQRQLMGEALSSMSIKELKQLETRLEKGINRIRSKKNELLFAEIEYMQKKEIDLQNDNMYLRAKIAENERAQQMGVMPTSEYESMPPQLASFDNRNFLQVNLMQPTHHYSRQEPTALQLG
ncbi:agamous-like MADS-box protein MADS1 isoform X2 [Macadamia integrifolia]|uniref:agamous-like MADS-box protein MADS1 isoform X2 n=1 Tax=Macadamia integrifolia TaxID=60698 RepID=UPI001C4FD735|nr:agamous-like MADS-box protein MADS1 isoform X2 [Macadamia integrifolia]